MKNEYLARLTSISLKTRILREWQKSNRAQDQEFTERELLTLELIEQFDPITEKSLSKIFGIPYSSVAEIIKKLAGAGAIDLSDKAKGKPLRLTKKGGECLAQLKEASAARLTYLFDSVTENEWKVMSTVFEKVDKNVERTIQQLVFDRAPSVE